MGVLLTRATSRESLGRAWEDVLANDSEDGQLGAGVSRFAADAASRLDTLAADLSEGTYEPADLTEVVIDGESHRRTLHIPSVRDRIIERSLLEQVTPWIDPWLGPAAYAFRPGLGVADAVQEVARLREEGLGWVLRTDVHDCFPSVPVHLARRMFGALVPDEDLGALVDRLLARGFRRERGGRAVMRGLAQGCALSPMLANLVLTGLDDALAGEGFTPVRYADDVAVVTESRDDAWEAARVATAALERIGMELGADKTEVMSFEEGFCFLGEDFGPRYPPVLDRHRVVEPSRRVLYTALQGGRVRTEAGRLIVESAEDAEVLNVPTGHVERIVCFGAVGISAGVRTWALRNDADVVFASRTGSYLGQQLSTDSSTRVARLRAQLACADDPVRALRLAGAMVEAKVRKQIVVLQRFGRRTHATDVSEAVAEMQHMLALLTECQSAEEVMGVEGAAASAYFPAFGGLFPQDLRFVERSRQPPLDLTNSGLSFLYTVLLGEAVTALVTAGLDPAIGVLHADHERRPSLALDLMEEFRPLIVDQVVLAAARKGELRAEHARSEPGRAGVLLTKAGRAAVLDGYERRMLTTTRGALPGFAGSMRRHLYRQAQRLAAVVSDPDALWTGLSWR